MAGLFVFVLGSNCRAQDTLQLSLSQAWQLAFHTYPGLKQTQEQITAAQFNKSVQRAGLLPSIQLQAQNTFGTLESTAGAFFPLPGIFNVSGSAGTGAENKATTNFYGSAVAELPILTFGKIKNNIRIADQQLLLAKSNLSAYQLQLQVKVTRLYFDILYEQANLKWATENAQRVAQIKEIAQSLAGAGLKPGADTALAASSYLQVLSQQDDWLGKLQSGKIALTETVPLLHSAGYLVPERDYLNGIGGTLKLADTVSQHPYLDVYQKDIQVSEAREKAAGSQAMPTLTLIGGYGERSSGALPDGRISGGYSAAFNNMAGNYLVGVGLTWNISSLYTSTLQKKRAAAEVRANKYDYEREQLAVNTRVSAIAANLNEQLKRSVKTNAAVVMARRAYELYLARYQSGLISLTDLLQIQSLLQQAEKVNIDTHQQLWDQLIVQCELHSDFSPLVTHF